MKREELIKFAQQFYADKETCIKNVDTYLATQTQQSAKVTDEMIKTEMDNYFNKLQRNPLPDLERFRIEIAFEYAAKWAREQMKNR